MQQLVTIVIKGWHLENQSQAAVGKSEEQSTATTRCLFLWFTFSKCPFSGPLSSSCLLSRVLLTLCALLHPPFLSSYIFIHICLPLPFSLSVWPLLPLICLMFLPSTHLQVTSSRAAAQLAGTESQRDSFAQQAFGSAFHMSTEGGPAPAGPSMYYSCATLPAQVHIPKGITMMLQLLCDWCVLHCSCTHCNQSVLKGFM